MLYSFSHLGGASVEFYFQILDSLGNHQGNFFLGQKVRQAFTSHYCFSKTERRKGMTKAKHRSGSGKECLIVLFG